jgi:hypothetical protein
VADFAAHSPLLAADLATPTTPTPTSHAKSPNEIGNWTMFQVDSTARYECDKDSNVGQKTYFQNRYKSGRL